MLLWDQFVELFRVAIFSYSQVCGGNVGLGIMLVTLLVRLALFPFTLHLARLNAAHQALMMKLKPELDELRSRFKDNPQRLSQETQKLFKKEGASPFPMLGCFGNLLQMPLWLGLFAAVRRSVTAGAPFLWIRNLASPDLILSVSVAALTFASVVIGSDPSAPINSWWRQWRSVSCRGCANPGYYR